MKPQENRFFFDTGFQAHPMLQLASPKLAEKETILKREVDAYYVSEVDKTAHFSIGKQRYRVSNVLDLPDATCQGLTFKLRLVEVDTGTCFLLARWKPDRYMRRASAGRGQKWFIEKQLFPKDKQRLFARLAADSPIDFPPRPSGGQARSR